MTPIILEVLIYHMYLLGYQDTISNFLSSMGYTREDLRELLRIWGVASAHRIKGLFITVKLLQCCEKS